MALKKYQKLAIKEKEAYDALEKAYVEWVKSANAERAESSSMFDGMSYMEIIGHMLHMTRYAIPKEYPSDLTDRFHIMEQQQDGSFTPVLKKVKFQIVLE